MSSIKKILFLIISFAVVGIYSINASGNDYIFVNSVKETTKSDSYDTIERNSTIIGNTKFTSDEVITALKATKAGSDNAVLYYNKNSGMNAYTMPQIYIYYGEIGGWYSLNEENVTTYITDNNLLNKLSEQNIYFVNNIPKAVYVGNYNFNSIDTNNSNVIYKDSKVNGNITNSNVYVSSLVSNVQINNLNGTNQSISLEFDDQSGMFESENGNDKITCSAGKYLKANSSTCNECPAGKYCIGGTYKFNASNNQGITGDCNKNTYSTGGASAATCTACPGGMNTASTGSTAKTSCRITCTAGTHLAANASTCSSCPAGKYCSSSGTYNFNESSAQGITGTCAAGTYAQAGSSSCSNCIGRTKYSSLGAESCSTVTAGYYTTGCTGNDKCTGQSECTAGNYCLNGVSTACAAGSYSSSEKSTSCTPCTAGLTGNAGRTSQCTTSCSNSSNVATWNTPSWSANTVNNLCSIKTCNTGYISNNDSCIVMDKLTLAIKKNDSAWNESGISLSISSSSTNDNSLFTQTITNGSIWQPSNLLVGSTYYVWAGKNQDNKTSRVYTGTSFTVSSNQVQAIDINYYVVTINRNNSNYGTVSKDSFIVLKNQTMTANGNVLTISGTNITATKTDASGYETSFSKWTQNTTSGTQIGSSAVAITSAKTVYANFTRSANSYQCSTGQYLSKNSTSCSSCPAGKYCTGGKYSFNENNDQGITGDCNKNTYSTGGASAATCTACPGSMTTSSTGSTAKTSCIITCNAGQYLAANGSSCSSCPAGKYCSSEGTYNFNASNNQGITGDCNKNTYSIGGATAATCTACPGSMTTTSTGSTAKTSCRITCNAGQYLAANGSSCSSCPAGKYCSSEGTYSFNASSNQGITGDCNKNTYSTGGATAATCTACPGSMTTTSTGSTAKTSCRITCAAGKHLAADASACSNCPAGKYCSSEGTYNFNASSAQGITGDCNKNTYSTGGATAATCTACPGSMTTSSTGSTAKTNCRITCNAGTHLAANASSCSNCPAGKYCSSEGTYNFNASSAQGITGDCNTGSYSTGGATAATCTSCGKGYTSPSGSTASSACTTCSNSAHVATWSSGCTIETCASGYTLSNNVCAANSISCTAGNYLPANSSSCSSCPAGKYCTGGSYTIGSSDQGITGNCNKNTYSTGGASAATCTACPGSMTTASTGSTAKTSCRITCSVGTHLAADASACSNCPSGKYCSSEGTYNFNASSAQGITGTCAAGTYAQAGSSSCSNCTGRTKYSSSGAESCSTVTAGYYTTGCTGNDKCTGQSECTAGNYCLNGVSTACAAGSYSSSEKSTSCTPCTAGLTGNAGRTSQCTASCSNASNVATWNTPSWSANTVSNLCSIKTCNNNYSLSNNSCVALTNYSITYTLNGGSATNPTSYNSETATFTLQQPTRNGYTFAGWTGSNGSTPTKVVTIAKGSTGNKSYTANWEINVKFAGIPTQTYFPDTIVIDTSGSSYVAGGAYKAKLDLNTEYVLSFDYKTTVNTNKFNVDFYSNADYDLPEINLTASTTLQHYDWEFTTQSTHFSDSSLKVRFFDDIASSTDTGVISITNVYLTKVVNVTKINGKTIGSDLPSNSSSIFGGWYTGSNGSGTQITSSSVVPNEHVTYYSNYNKVHYFVPTTTYSNDSYIVANYNVLDYGAKGDGTTDDTEAFKMAIESANNCAYAEKCYGYTVYVPSGTYVISEPLVLGSNIGLIGDLQKGTTNGTVLKINHNTGSAIKMDTQSAIMNMAFYYPDQGASSSGYTKQYPATITQIDEHSITLKNINFVNSYVAMDFSESNHNNNNQQLTDIYGSPLIGLKNDLNYDTIRVTNLNFSSSYWLNSTVGSKPTATNLNAALKNHGEGIRFNRVDWYFLSGVTIDNYNIGIHFKDSTALGSSTANPEGSMYDVRVTNCDYPLYVESSRHFVITNSTFTTTNSAIAAIEVSSSDNFSLNKCTLSGYNAITNRGNGNISISDSNITGYINRGNPNTHITFLSDTLTNSTSIFEGLSVSDYNTAPSDIDYNKSVTTKPGTKNIKVIEATENSNITTQLTNAINSLNASGGGIVYIPPGKYEISSSITVKSNVEIRGSIPWFHDWIQWNRMTSGDAQEHGTILTPTFINNSVFVLNSNSGLNGLNIKYNKQTIPNSASKAFTIKGSGNHVYIMNISMPNSWKGIDLATNQCDNHYVDGIWGEFYEYGIKVGGGSKDGIVKNSHAHINVLIFDYYFGTKDLSFLGNQWIYIVNHQIAYELGSTTNEVFFNNFSYNAAIAFNVIDGASNFSMLTCGGDDSGIASYKLSGSLNGQIVNPLMTIMHAENWAPQPDQPDMNFHSGIDPSTRRYIKSDSTFSTPNGKVNIVNSMSWSGGNAASAFEFEGSGDLHLYSGLVDHAVAPVVINKNLATSLFGLIIKPSANVTVRYNSGSSASHLIGNICNTSSGYTCITENNVGSSLNLYVNNNGIG